MLDNDLKQRLSRIGRVAVLAGGASAERSVSLKSGAAVHQGLRKLGLIAELVDPSEVDVDTLKGFEVAFIALHGRGGEDGVIQGVLEHLGLPYTGSGVMASAIGMDKVRTKQLWKGAGLPTPDFYVAGRDDHPMGYPLMVKPSHEGSSIGMAKVDSESELAKALDSARRYDSEVLVEAWVNGPEYTVAIVDGRALPAIRLKTPNAFYDFEAKYQANTTEYLCPAGLSDSDEQALRELSLRAFRAVGCQGWGRVDVMRDQNGDWQLLEVNTVPGMTDHSLVPMAAKADGDDFPTLVARILLEAVDRFPPRRARKGSKARG
ncbi:D-alanine--D-alanine ligase [Alloalcanivorax mobilis]|uniref:D-alanine--D-alanine ligase n=1 Tax=Alloalcanivorax mobilis TaxID=2019569 RepID=UPI000C76CB3F|nr:D-alanine--D-alanine ligase [Alloalcanivorax mobilis]